MDREHLPPSLGAATFCRKKETAAKRRERRKRADCRVFQRLIVASQAATVHHCSSNRLAQVIKQFLMREAVCNNAAKAEVAYEWWPPAPPPPAVVVKRVVPVPPPPPVRSLSPCAAQLLAVGGLGSAPEAVSAEVEDQLVATCISLWRGSQRIALGNVFLQQSMRYYLDHGWANVYPLAQSGPAARAESPSAGVARPPPLSGRRFAR
jgi:hypothetical protein